MPALKSPNPTAGTMNNHVRLHSGFAPLMRVPIFCMLCVRSGIIRNLAENWKEVLWTPG